jgi:pyruvate kinase
VHGETVSTSSELALPVPQPSFFKSVAPGDLVTVGDGNATLTVLQVSSQEIVAESTTDGVIDQCRGLIVQGTSFRPASLTPKDVRDLDHILSSRAFDVVALSFVSSASDLARIRRVMETVSRPIPILAKIETPEGVDNIDEICRGADMVMAARGDLALTMPLVELPAAVDHIASRAQAHSTPWILATQIMEGLEQ